MKWNAERSTFTVLLVAGTVLWIPLLRRMLGGNRGFLANLGFASGPRASAVAWVLALAVAGIYAGYTIRNIPLVRRHWLRSSLLKAVALVAAVGAAVVEEAFFRRVLMDWLMSRGTQPLIQIMLSGIAFGAAHGTWGMLTGRVRVGLRVMVATGSLGIALAAVYVIGSRSLAPVIVSHFLITASIQPGILLAAFSGHIRRPPSVAHAEAVES